jgi:glucose-6-phosphate-specific signal transduction histidine kinase
VAERTLPPSRWRADLWLIVGATLACYAVASALDLHESFVAWVAQYERWQLDELALALPLFAAGMAWYGVRRRREALAALHLSEQAQARVTELLARNRELAQQLIRLQESERLALARELHDELGQTCNAIRLETAFIRRCADDDRAGVLAAAARADAAAQTLYRSVREMLRRLRPANLDELGLVAALEELCQSWQVRNGMPCVFRRDGQPPEPRESCGDAIDVTLYRVAQEALNNITRHAHASVVQVLVSWDVPDEVMLIVQDDGRGLAAEGSTRGLGLLGAAERAALHGGSLVVAGKPGAGVRVCLRIPLTAAVAAEPATAHATDPVTEHATEPVAQPTVEPAAAAMATAMTSPDAGALTEPLVDPTSPVPRRSLREAA